MIRKTSIFIFCLPFLLFATWASAEIPKGYYDLAIGKSEAQLKSSLYTIISTGYKQNSYAYLYTIFEESDMTEDGKVWDMYSTCTWFYGQKQCGNYKEICDCYNREHTIPQSWFDKKSPMVSDAFHIYPVDGKVNGHRSNFPFGECASGKGWANGKGKLGKSSFPGYSGTVYEPDDEYKGDMARTYFYFATRYENIMKSIGGESFNNTTYPSFPAWTQNLFLKWHREDPVSEKEINRNEVVYKHQKNRNPFIDHPELVEYIWGTKTDKTWDVNSSVDFPDYAVFFQFDVESKTIKLNINHNDIDYSIFNIDGQQIKNGTVNPFEEISVNDISSGIYIISFNSNQIKTVRKFIIY